MKTGFLFALIVVLIVGYNNCSGHHTGVQGSAGLAASGTSCDAVLLQKYQASVYGFVHSDTTCKQCHVEGGIGLGVFASDDLQRSYAAFTGVGLSKIGYMATNPQHKPPYTGEQNQAAIAGLNDSWPRAEQEYLECLSKIDGGGIDESLLTSAKPAPAIYSDTNSQELSWDLDLAEGLDEAAHRALPARLSITVKVLYQTFNGVEKAKGYVFSNPTLLLKDASTQVVIEGLYIYINRALIANQTTFVNVSKVVGGTQPMLLMKADGNTIIDPVATTDVFSVFMRRAILTSATDDSTPPLTPLMTVTDMDTGSKTHLQDATARVSILRDSGIVRWCLSESPTRPASTEAPCDNPGAPEGALNGWQITRPTEFRFSAGDGAKTVYLWVANENLKINSTPATVTLTLDTVAPPAAVISDLTVTDTQVASLSISNAADVSGWCVWEQNAVLAAPNRPALDHACWQWSYGGSKPDSVGFRGGGQRDVWVFVRDQAGNVSTASNKLTGTNPFGPITFALLKGPAGNPQAVFTNSCATCHADSANPGYQRVRLFEYAEAVKVADSGVLVSRTNNPLSPMPNVNGGLLEKKYRDLIRLWASPEGTDTPLP